MMASCPLVRPNPFKIDKSIFRIGFNEPDLDFIPDKKPALAGNDPAFSRKGQEPDIGSFF